MSIPSFTRKFSFIFICNSSTCLPAQFTNLLDLSKGLVRFISKTTNEVSIGKPVDEDIDVGSSMRTGKDVEV